MSIVFKEFSIPDDDLTKAAGRIAMHFYKELRKNEFEDNQIIEVATELISILSSSLEGYKKRIDERE